MDPNLKKATQPIHHREQFTQTHTMVTQVVKILHKRFCMTK